MALENGKDVDIQDVFDSILLSEDTFASTGYQEGFKQGEVDGYQEGLNLGEVKGKEIGSEISFYRGFAKGFIAQLSGKVALLRELDSQLEVNRDLFDSQTISALQDLVSEITESNQDYTQNSKRIKVLQKLIEKIAEFPEENIKDQDFGEKLRDIRARFKHCCSLLKVETSFSSEQSINF